MNEKFNIQEMLALNLIDDELEKQDIENQIKKSYLDLERDINKNTSNPDSLINFNNSMAKYSNYKYDNSDQFDKWAKETKLANIVSVEDAKEEIMNYFNNAQDSRIRDNWNALKENDYEILPDNENYDSYSYDTDTEMIDSYLPKDYPRQHNAYIYADLSYSKHNQPYGYVADFDTKNITPELKKEIFNNIKNSDPNFFNNLEEDELNIK